jgi:undecaprenyl-phosphate 4-deoxy-4-formamido-L-arabinose transferase
MIIKRNLPKSKIKLINMKENVGQQKATFIGLMEANSDYTVIMDDDLETNPSDILKLYNEVMKGYDVVYGININDKGKSFHRTFGALMRDVMFRVLTKIPKGMKVCSFRIMNKSVVNQILKSNKRFVYISMEILRFTSNISNIFVPYNKNKESNYTMKKLIKLYMNILINYGFKGTLSSNNDLYEPDYTVLGEDYL